MGLIECRNISHSYRQGGAFSRCPRKPVLTGIDLTIEAGACVALLGPSGSGKSTLGRLILGLEAPSQGCMLYRGTPLAALRGDAQRAFRRAVQVVFQDSLSALDPRLTIARSIEEPLRHLTTLDAGARERRVTELLESVALPPGERDKLPGQMSGGQLQRVCIARALAANPELIVLDEAVSSLDLVLQLQILDLLTGLRQRLGTAYLFITHDLRLASRFAERIAVLHAGRIVEDVGAEAPLSHPASRALAGAVLPARPASPPQVPIRTGSGKSFLCE